MEFEGKVAVITGAASGIGRSVALALAKRGTDIVIADIDDVRMEEVRQEIDSMARHALAIHCDVSKDADVENLATQTLSIMGKADILMNNAGISVYGNFDRMTVADYEFIFSINFFGVIRGVLAFLPHMLGRGSGYIINTASHSGLYGRWEPYCISKHALIGYSEGLYGYLRPKGIMVSVLCPGIANTNLLSHSTFVGSEQEIKERKILVEKLFTAPEALLPDDVAEVVVKGMEEERFFILTQGIDKTLNETISRGQDIQKLDKYLKDTYNTYKQ